MKERGLLGDHRAAKLRLKPNHRAREITPMKAKALPLIAQWIGLIRVDPSVLRSHLVIGGINLRNLHLAFAGARLVWQLGHEVVLLDTGFRPWCTHGSAAQARRLPCDTRARRPHQVGSCPQTN